MNKITCFGEVLWDVFPTHKKIGGAPLNVALRLHSFQNDVTIISSVGDDKNGKELLHVISEINYEVENDSIVPNFRSLAVTEKDVFAMSIGDPALLYKNGNVVYKETHPKVFYDSIEFWNDNEGIAVGDYTDNCISVIIISYCFPSLSSISSDNFI